MLLKKIGSKEDRNVSKFEVTVSWSGRSRGESVYVVEAEDEDVARETYDIGELALKYTIRSDIEYEVESVKDITPSNK